MNPAGGLLACDAAARRVLESEDGDDLRGALAALPPLGKLKQCWFPVHRASGRLAYLLRVSELMNGHAAPNFRSVSVFEPALDSGTEREALSAAFGFTPAETRLALELLGGRTAQEAAAATRVSIHTVRTYLKRLYRKVGVRSQPALLVRLLQATRMLPPAASALAGAGPGQEQPATRACE